MRFSAGKLLTSLLLALYGSVSLLGYGLHEIAGVHHHDHGVPAVAAQVGHHHHHGPCSHHHGPAGGSLTHAHDCEICVFLDQVRSEVPQLATAEFTEQLIADAVVAAPRVFSETAIGLHAPRGPPALVG
jgi:hypothetical protein